MALSLPLLLTNYFTYRLKKRKVFSMSKKKEVSATSVSNPSGKVSVIPKMDFHLVNDVFETLHFAFHPSGFDDNREVDQRFIAHWHLFLVTVGWSENEFWETRKELEEEVHKCPDCGRNVNSDEDLELPETKDPSVNKPN
jgi:hypothetical protein